MTLLELQRRMLGDLLVPPDAAPLTEAATYITDSARLEAAERLAIYRRSYWARLRDAVAEDFPALRTVVGRRRFAALIDAYLLAHPSRSWTLRNLSRALPDWLAAHPEHAGRRWRAAVDAARVEWAYIECFDAASHAPLSREAVAQIGPESPLRLQPHLRLLALESNMEERVIAAHREATEAGAGDDLDNDLDNDLGRRPLPRIRRGKVYLAVHRMDGVVYYRRLDRGMFGVLDALQASGSLAEGVDRFLRSSWQRGGMEARMEKLRETLALAAQLGWLCQVCRA